MTVFGSQKLGSPTQSQMNYDKSKSKFKELLINNSWTAHKQSQEA